MIQSYPRAFLMICLFLLSTCNNVTTVPDMPDADTVQSFKGDVADLCFDIQLQVWMEKFQKNQQSGMDMFAADIKARESALNAYQGCRSRRSTIMAAGHARK